MKHRVFARYDLVFVCAGGGPYLAVVLDALVNEHRLVPVITHREFLQGGRTPHLVFAYNLRGALWTFTGYVEEPHDSPSSR